jgi:hypothetical protein
MRLTEPQEATAMAIAAPLAQAAHPSGYGCVGDD